MDNSPVLLLPRTIGMEVEVEKSYLAEKHHNWEDDHSGPKENQSGVHTNPTDLAKEISKWSYVQSGGFNSSCGSHFHISMLEKPLEMDFSTYWEKCTIYFQTYRVLTPFFSPFFAGSRSKQDDFHYRSNVMHWAGMPEEVGSASLSNWSGGKKNWWCAPHNNGRHGKKPMTVEIRLNEAPPLSAATGADLICRIALQLVQDDVYPDFPKELQNLDIDIVNHRITNLSGIRSVLTKKTKVAESLGNMFHSPIKANKEYSLSAILRTFLKAELKYPLLAHERHWICRILSHKTWTHILSSADNTKTMFSYTKKFNRLK